MVTPIFLGNGIASAPRKPGGGPPGRPPLLFSCQQLRFLKSIRCKWGETMETGVNISILHADPGQHGHQNHPGGDGDPSEEAVPFFGGGFG